MYLTEFISAIRGRGKPVRLDSLVEEGIGLGLFGGHDFDDVASQTEAIVSQIEEYELGKRLMGADPEISVDPTTLVCIPGAPRLAPATEGRKAMAKSLLIQHTRLALIEMDSFDFEDFCAGYLGRRGYRECKRREGDLGIDVLGWFDAPDFVVRVAVQAKCWKIGNDITAKEVRDFSGSLSAEHAQDPRVPIQGIMITTSGFTSGAEGEQLRAPVPIL